MSETKTQRQAVAWLFDTLRDYLSGSDRFATPPVAPDHLVNVAERHRVLLTVCDILEQLGVLSGPLGNAFAGAVQRQLTERDRLRSTLEQFDGLLAGAGLAGTHYKGFAVEAVYPGPLRRRFLDLEIAVASGPRDSDLFPALSRAGFVCDRMLLRWDSVREDIGGIVHLRAPGTDVPGPTVELLIAEQPLSLTVARRLPNPDGAPGLHWADAAAGVAYLAGETTERRCLLLRDYLDMMWLAREVDEVHFNDVLRDAAVNGAGWGAGRLRLQQRLQATDFGPPSEHPVSLFVSAVARTPMPWQPQGVWWSACLRSSAVVRTLLLERRMRPVLERVGSWLDRRMDARALFESGHYVGFTRIGGAAVGGSGWIGGQPRSPALLASPLGVFVPNPLPVIAQARLDEVAGFIAMLRKKSG